LEVYASRKGLYLLIDTNHRESLLKIRANMLPATSRPNKPQRRKDFLLPAPTLQPACYKQVWEQILILRRHKTNRVTGWPQPLLQVCKKLQLFIFRCINFTFTIDQLFYATFFFFCYCGKNSINIISVFCRMRRSEAMYFFYNWIIFHLISSSGEHSTGLLKFDCAIILAILFLVYALFICLKLHVSRKSIP